MPEDIKIAIQLVDNISKELEALNKKIDKFGTDAAKNTRQATTGFDKLVNSVTTFIKGFIAFETVRRAGMFLLDTAKAAGEAEQAVISLGYALKAQNAFTKQAVDYYSAYASQLQITTGFQDEAIMSAQTLAIRYGYLGAANSRLITASTELSRQLGMDLNSAVMLLVRSMLKENDELGRLGITINGASGSAERFDSMLSGVEKRFSGSNKAFMESYSGAVADLANSFDEMKESIGAPLMSALATAAKGFADFFKRTVESANDGKIRVAEAGIESTKRFINEYNADLAKLQSGAPLSVFQKLMIGDEEELRKKIVLYSNMLIQQEKTLAKLKETPAGEAVPVSQVGTADTESDKEREARLAKEQKRQEKMWEWAVAKTDLEKQLAQESLDFDTAIAEEKAEMQIALIDEVEEHRKTVFDQQEKDLEDRFNYEQQVEATRKDAIKSTISNGLELVSMYKDNSIEMFNMTKAFSIAQATMNAYETISSVLKDPLLPFFLKIPAAASMGALAMAQVAKIASTPFKAAALGADFVTSGKQMLMVGDNPGGKERVQVTPLSSPNINGTKNINQTKIVPVLIIKGGNIVDELERASISNEIDWERILPREVMNAR